MPPSSVGSAVKPQKSDSPVQIRRVRSDGIMQQRHFVGDMRHQFRALPRVERWL